MAFDRIQDFSNRTDDVYAWGWWDERDLILGGDGDDTFRPAEGDDEVHGGDGNDGIEDANYSNNGIILTLFGVLFAELDYDGENKDMENRFATPAFRNGLKDAHESGDDVFFGDAGNDTLIGYSGDDTLDGGADSDLMWGGSGNDRIFGGTGVDGMFGNSGDDFMSGGADRDIMYGGSGSDIVLGGSGNDLLDGGTGADFLQGGLGGDKIKGGDLAADAYDLQVALGQLTRTQANALIAAANAGDTVNYDNSIFGVNVDFEREEQIGGDAEGDTIVGVENIEGSRTGDTLRGDNKVNILFGNSGDDRLEGRGGADTLEGGLGSDTASYESSSSRVIVDLIAGTGQLADAAGDSYDSIENLAGSRFDDILRGDDATAGNRLEGNDGRDTLDGRGGNDTLDGGLGNDTLIGGEGVDTAEFDAWDTPPPSAGVLFFAPKITIDLASGTATRSVLNVQNFSYDIVETDTMSGIENARGSNNADLFIGNSQNNTFFGREGNDTFKADAGSDTYNGDSGVDTVDYSGSATGVTVNLNPLIAGSGGFAQGDKYNSIENVIGTSGRDTLTGNFAANKLTGGTNDDILDGGGNDILIGGTGVDIMTGGTGADTFVFTSKLESVAAGNFDQILDFQRGADKIDLSAIDANELTSGNGIFTFRPFGQTPQAGDLIVNNVAFDSNGDGVNDSTFANVNFFVDGDQAADFALGVTLVGSLTGLTATDFVL